MSILIFVLMLCLTFTESPFNQTLEIENVFAVNQKIVDEVKKSGLWTPSEVLESVFKGWTTKQLKNLCGLKQSEKNFSSEFILNYKENENVLSLKSLPTSFDGRLAWSKCISPVRYQGDKCQSCWAFASVDTLGDIRCIKGKEASMVQLSPQDQVSCNGYNEGCQPSYLYYAYYYMLGFGVVKDSCLPYTSGNGEVPACPIKKCTNTTQSWIKYKCLGGFYNYKNDIYKMKNYLTTNGPMTLAMNVYEDFVSYKSGIYSRVSGSLVGGHAVKLVGYGVNGSTNYWICQNSWGTSWGMNGFFYIQQGQCYIESQAYSCLSDK